MSPGGGSDTAPVAYIARTRDTYTKVGYQPYSWVRSDEDPPMVRLSKPLSECRLGLPSSGGVYRFGQVALHYQDDTSFLAIDTSVPTSGLRVTHFAYDTGDARRDPNCVLPLDPLRELVSQGQIGALAPTAFGFMGGVYSARRVREHLAPELARHMVAQESTQLCSYRLAHPGREGQAWRRDDGGETREAPGRHAAVPPRADTPQYQEDADRDAAKTAPRTSGCPSCIGLEDRADGPASS